MKNTIALIFTLLILSGCGKMITVPLDPTPISTNDATVIIYHEQGFSDNFQIFLDKAPVGFVTSEKPLKISITPGEHELHTVAGGFIIDRVTKQLFEAGKIYYMRIWLDIGMWVSSIRIDPTEAKDKYEVRSHKQ
ncbi:MAG: hypothetical protein KJ630_06605 [Proteobacteria bacterium]|nr:hypothetical protein [Pseudomonadota bacterium]